MASSAPTLTYFPLEAAAEKVRLAFLLTGTVFEDTRIPFGEWGALKPTTPYGQLPTLTNIPDGDSSKVYSQSGAMVRYVAAKFDKTNKLYPTNDPFKLFQVEEMVGLVEDFQKAWHPCLYIGMNHQSLGYPENWPEKAATVEAMRTKFVAEGLPKFMGFFIEQIKKTGGAFLCGLDVTIADLWLLPQLRYFTRGMADHVPADCLDKYPEIIAYMQRCYTIEHIKNHYQM